MSDFKFQAAVQEIKNVEVIHLDQRIGTGKAIQTSDAIDVNGHYEWPPDAPAEVSFSFAVKILSSNICAVRVNWPGLLEQTIDDPQASYFVILLLGRPGLLISAGDNRISFTYTGPMGDPVKVTGFQISVTEPRSASVLTFRYQR